MLAECLILGKRGNPTLSDPFPIRHVSVTQSDDSPAGDRLRGFPRRYVSCQIPRPPSRLRAPGSAGALETGRGEWMHRTREVVYP
jgi:hypothetical protein